MARPCPTRYCLAETSTRTSQPRPHQFRGCIAITHPRSTTFSTTDRSTTILCRPLKTAHHGLGRLCLARVKRTNRRRCLGSFEVFSFSLDYGPSDRALGVEAGRPLSSPRVAPSPRWPRRIHGYPCREVWSTRLFLYFILDVPGLFFVFGVQLGGRQGYGNWRCGIRYPLIPFVGVREKRTGLEHILDDCSGLLD